MISRDEERAASARSRVVPGATGDNAVALSVCEREEWERRRTAEWYTEREPERVGRATRCLEVRGEERRQNTRSVE